MTDQEINQKIAVLCGWKETTFGWWEREGTGTFENPPDYCNDLNAMHEAEAQLSDAQCRHYFAHLCTIVEDDEKASVIIGYIHAPARQRAEAFLKTVGKWRDE